MAPPEPSPKSDSLLKEPGTTEARAGEAKRYGNETTWSRITSLDCTVWVASVLCCALSFASVYQARFAAYLGQTNQLILLGLTLGLMAYLFQGPAQKTLAAMEILWGHSTLQNIEAITQMEVLGDNKSIRTRLSVLFMLGLPLALSVAYKQFTGGVTAVEVGSDLQIEFGPTPPPGTANIGWGLSLFSSTMQPWWSNPQYPGFYGYSLATISRNQTALLDGPLEASVLAFRRHMRPDQHFVVNATVAAVEAELVEEWYSKSLESADTGKLLPYMGWSQGCNNMSCNNSVLLDQYLRECPGVVKRASMIYTIAHTAAMAVGTCNATHPLIGDNSFVLISRTATIFSSDDDLSGCQEGAQAFRISFQRYRASWNISRDAASLLDAARLGLAPLENATHNFTDIQHKAIESTYYDLDGLYLKFLPEYDWRYPQKQHSGAADLGIVDYSREPVSNVTTDTTFASAMVWSRFATKIGPTNKEYAIGFANRGVFRYTQPVELTVYT